MLGSPNYSTALGDVTAAHEEYRLPALLDHTFVSRVECTYLENVHRGSSSLEQMVRQVLRRRLQRGQHFGFGSLVASSPYYAELSFSYVRRWGIREGKPIDNIERQGIDADLGAQFGETLDRASQGQLDNWLDSGARGTLALVILLDQLSRNIHRGTARAFAMDGKTVELSKALLDNNSQWTELHPIERIFAILPLEHSENMDNHRLCQAAFEKLEIDSEAYPPHIRNRIANSKQFCEQHSAVVRQFGRYPHRNAVLGRTSTPEEVQFLENGASSWGQ